MYFNYFAIFEDKIFPLLVAFYQKIELFLLIDQENLLVAWFMINWPRLLVSL